MIRNLTILLLFILLPVLSFGQNYEWAKSIWWIILGGIPISFCFYYGTRWYYEYFQNYWYVRPIGFGMATMVFGVLTWLILNETPDMRTWITLFLSLVIIVIQLSHLIVK